MEYTHTNYPFFAINDRNLPHINSRQYTIIRQICKQNKSLMKRIMLLKARGYDVRRCYIPNYNKICGLTYMPKLKEIRIIVGNPPCHLCKDVYAIIIK